MNSRLAQKTRKEEQPEEEEQPEMDITYNPAYGDTERRERIYRGELFILPPNSASADLVEHARSMIEAAFAPHDPRRAHRALSVEETVRILSALKPEFIHHPTTRELLRRTLAAFGSDDRLTYQDVPRLRAAYPVDYLTTGIAYAHHPHRDTWYSAPACQFNWWMPIYEFTADQGMAFHAQYWNVPIRNTSREFDYYRWNTDGRKNAAQHIKRDTRIQPHAEEPLSLDPEVRFVVPIGGVILFSADQLHSTARNKTSTTRWSMDFRTVNIQDVQTRRGAKRIDAACSGTSLRDFRRMSDSAEMPESAVKMYDNTEVGEGVAVFQA